MPTSFPVGWYVPFLSSDLKAGEVKECAFFGQKLVAFRTLDGKAAVASAICPHMGADLSKGRVTKEGLRCPFHGFCFDSLGACTRTYIEGETPPAKAQLKNMPLIEKEGLIFVFYHPKGEAPHWFPMELGTEEYVPLKGMVKEIAGGLEDIAENAFDFIHLMCVHQFEEAKIIQEPSFEAHTVTGIYGIKEGLRFLGLHLFKQFVQLHIHEEGLGLAWTKVSYFGIDFLLYTLPTPIDSGKIQILLAAHYQDPFRNSKFLKWVMLPIKKIGSSLALKNLVSIIKQDIDVWHSQIHLEKPLLSKSDLFIGKFRQHIKQFYLES